jgi:hypothetical protein
MCILFRTFRSALYTRLGLLENIILRRMRVFLGECLSWCGETPWYTRHFSKKKKDLHSMVKYHSDYLARD